MDMSSNQTETKSKETDRNSSQPTTSDNSRTIVPPAYYYPAGSTPFDQFNPPEKGATGRADIRKEMDQMNLVDTWVQFGQQRCQVKERFFCGGEELYALESNRSLVGYDGKCPKCRKIHADFAELNKGFYVSVKLLHEKVFNETLAEKDRKDIGELPLVHANLPPLDHPVLGEYRGIEGDSNSCYMDSTIFCMFAYSSVFDLLLHVEIDKESIRKLQKLLRENIVHVLRSDSGFVERDALFHLRAQLSETTGDSSFKEMDKDPCEFLRALEELFHYAPLRTIRPDQPPNENGSNVTTNIIWEMFDANPQNLLSTNIASLFRNSLAEIPAKLATIPPFLVLVAPRHAHSQRSYRYIKPDLQVTLDNDVLQFVCRKCKKTNHGAEKSLDFYSCYECDSKDSSLRTSLSIDATAVCYCNGCQAELHRKLTDRERLEHNPQLIRTDKHKLNLFAVLCIETSHYVAFVKCQKQNDRHEWLFFDSASDRVHDEKNVPLVDRVPDFDRWIADAENNKSFFKDLDDVRKLARPASEKFDENGMRRLRLFRDGAFFFYENPSVNFQ